MQDNKASRGGDRTDTSSGSAPLKVIGIGGSAGALQALLSLLETIDGNVPAALVVVLHLAPDHQSQAAEILQRVTSMRVTQVTERTRLATGQVYVIAPGMNLVTDDGYVQPAEADSKRPSTVIDLFLRTLAQVHKERSIGIILSGTGRDGSLGIAKVREHGGLTIVQEPEDCEHAEMPRAAIATGSTDLVLSASEIGRRLSGLANFSRSVISRNARKSPGDAVDAQQRAEAQTEAEIDDRSPELVLQDILSGLRRHTRYDFRHYKRGTIMRRLERRMQVVGLESLAEYRELARKRPEEYVALLADLLISVTNFFRDPDAFEALQRNVVPQIMESVAPSEEVRAWVTACASGEESYSIAILLQEYAERMVRAPRLQLFASDISDSALQVARTGVYPANIAADVTESRLHGYFEREDGDFYRVRTAVRETIVFARHNALADPPFSRLDLICCRNLLIYLDRTAQAELLETFAYALKPGGYLFLGNAESVDALDNVFEIVDKEHRIYRLKSDASRMRIPAQLVGNPGMESGPQASSILKVDKRTEEPLALLHEQALVASSPPSVLINANYDIERVSSGASRFVAFGEGVPSRNLLNNIAPDIRLELRTALFAATKSGKPARAVFRREQEDGDDKGPLLELSIHPVKGNDATQLFWLVRFDEAASDGLAMPVGVEPDGAAYRTAMQRLEDENRSLKANLQDTLDRSAVSGEELKSSNEELQSINEELRSAKEELETSKEELQSVNEELTTVNFELRMKVEEAGRNNDDLRNLMEAGEIATVFVDSAMCVKRFTPQASKLFALIPTDVGRPLMDVKTRLEYKELVDDALAVFKNLRPLERTVATVDGSSYYLARFLPYRTSADKIGGAVLTFIDVTELRSAQERVHLAEDRLSEALGTSKDFAVISTDSAGTILAWNEGAARIFGFPAGEVLGQSIDLIFTQEDRAAGVPQRERAEAERSGRAADERWHVKRDGSKFFCSGVMTRLQDRGFVKIARDVSESKNLELKQRADLSEEQRASAAMRHTSELKDRFLATMSHELKQPLNLIYVNAEMLLRLPAPLQVPAVHKIGNSIMRAVTAQDKIVNDLLDLSRVQTGKLHLQRQITDVAEITRQLGHAMEVDAASRGLSLEVHAPQVVMCDCDSVRFEQIVWNLLGNAMKFTGKGGRIVVRLSVDGASMKLEVADSGVGISPTFLPKVFDLFAQDTSTATPVGKRSGLGIGLSLVRELVQAHDGRVGAASPGEGQGSTFTVWLPLAQTPPDRDVAPAQSTVLQRRILMVDDDVDSLKMFAAVLRREGASVDTAESAAAALDLLAGQDYDVVLSDIGMPDMSGLEFMQHARKNWPHKSFYSVAITGYAAEEDKRAAAWAGFNAHLSKPVSVARLADLLEKAHIGSD